MIDERWAAVRARVDTAASAAGRGATDVRIIAVSKKHPATAIAAAHAAGVRDIGESYAQELSAKRDEVGELEGLRWHFIGRLQRNKAKLVVGRVALIHAVDSERLACAIDEHAAAAGVVQPVLIAVNIAGEASKGGVEPEAAESLLALIDRLPHTRCQGLMTMPPWPDHPEDNRAHFRALSALRDRLRLPKNPLPELSMGTSDDFEVAVSEGATLVRVGTAIFGPRPQ